MTGNQYVFFDELLRDRFVRVVSQHSLIFQARPDTIEGFVVEVSGEPDEDVLDALEVEYEKLMNEQMVLAESREGWVTHQVAGVTVARANGTPCVVRLSASIARPLLEHFTTDQIHDLVQAIAQSIEKPIDGPLCKRA
jgi:hypothetical protein